MKVKITATITLETELEPWHYEAVEGGPKTDDEIIPYEMRSLADGDSTLTEGLFEDGELSNIKIEKIEEAAQAQSEAA
jgi:hypothetical protein